MKNRCLLTFPFFLSLSCTFSSVNVQNKGLKLIFIRHAERPADGDNLTCRGFNRSILLTGVLYKKFGVPSNVYVPSLKLGGKTKRARMLQTITPLAIKYNLTINSGYDEADYKGIGNALMKEKGTVIIVWEHNDILPIIRFLGIRSGLPDWPDNDFDSIWIVDFKNGTPGIAKDKEGLNPSENCSF